MTAPVLPLGVYGEVNIRLGKIEAEENVTILFAVESGSRAWGFPSPDSDNDVRFLYVRPLSQYLGLETPRDVIERPLEEPWDLNGWDLSKALRLLVKGNATVSEWLSSPLIYREHGSLPYRLRDLIKRNASPQASARHYYGLTRTSYLADIARIPPDINLKKYLYSMRGACAIAWIRRYEEVPPMTLPALLSMDIIPDNVRSHLNALLRRKAAMGEIGSGPRIFELDNFIEEQIAWVKDQGMDKMAKDQVFTNEANRLFLDALGVGRP